MTRVILSIGLFASVLSPASVEAQVFGKGARTEFLTGFGFRTFVSVLEMTEPVGGELLLSPQSVEIIKFGDPGSGR